MLTTDHAQRQECTPSSTAIACALALLALSAVGLPVAAMSMIDTLADGVQQYAHLSTLLRAEQLIREPSVAGAIIALILTVSIPVHTLLIRLLSSRRVTLRGAATSTLLMHVLVVIPVPVMTSAARALRPMIAGPTGDGMRELNLFIALAVVLYCICGLVMLPRIGALAPARGGRIPVRSVLLRLAMLLHLLLIMAAAWFVDPAGIMPGRSADGTEDAQVDQGSTASSTISVATASSSKRLTESSRT